MITEPTPSATQRLLETDRFGSVVVETSSLLSFTQPILGFENEREYVLINHEEESPFKWLQSTENPSLAFVVTNPTLFGMEYDFTVPQSACDALGLQTAEEAQVLTLVTIPPEVPVAMTVNLVAPIIFNETTRQAIQLILGDETGFSTKVRLLSEEAIESHFNSDDA
jgi:flagellar assembly factor FliW